ncbi:MAG TPA: phenylalanine--tRNA ligase subunit alpha, partial [Bacillota bacterium]|nr:phenylalanine--tRNA ligase subunit alpha [Bacillota bacterium]
MQQRLNEILERALREIKECRELVQLENSRVKYLGKKGELTVFLRGMGDLSPEERPAMGRLVNQAKEEVETLLAVQRERVLQLEKERRLQEEEIDITVPGKGFARGKRHPLTKTLDEIKSIFMGLGFTVM